MARFVVESKRAIPHADSHFSHLAEAKSDFPILHFIATVRIAQVFLGGMEADPEDLSRLLFMEFALSFGNDWFIAPVELEIGAVHHLRSLVITDTFGERTLIRPYHEMDGPDADWRMFCTCSDQHGKPDAAGNSENLLLLPPSLAAVEYYCFGASDPFYSEFQIGALADGDEVRRKKKKCPCRR